MLPWQPFLAFYIWGAHWCHLKNTTELSMCGGDVALCQITLTTCLKLRRLLVIVFVTFMPISLLLQEFRGAVEEANKSLGRPVVPGAVVDHIIRYLPQLQCLNEELLADLKGRLDNWYCQL